MRRIFYIAILFSTFAVFSCKTHQTTVAYTPTGSEKNKPPTDGMTAEQATEEETFVKGCIEKNAGNYTRALIDFQQCLAMNPKSAAANYEVAGIYIQNKEPDLALKYAKAANDLSPENKWYKFRYADVLLANGQQDEALKIYKASTETDPKNTDLLFRYGNALKKAGKNDDALSVYNKIENIEGISDTLANAKISVYEQTKDVQNEEKTWVELVKYFPTPENYSRKYSFEVKNLLSADMTLAAWMKDFPEDAEPQLKMAELQMKSDVVSDRPKGFQTAKNVFSSPGDVDDKIAFLEKNYFISDSEKLNGEKQIQADTLCALLRKANPTDVHAWTQSGNYFYSGGKLKDAADCFHKAGALGENEYAPWKKLMEINNSLKDDVTQEKDCRVVMELFPTQPDAYYYLGEIYYRKKDYKKAGNWMQAGLDLSPDDARMNEAMGDIQYRLEKPDDALKFWNIAKEKGGANPELDKKISNKKLEDNQ